MGTMTRQVVLPALLALAVASAQKLSVSTYSVGGTPKQASAWRASQLVSILEDETSDVVALQDTSSWFTENVMTQAVRSKWKVYNISHQSKGPPRLVMLSKYTAASESLEIIDPEVNGFTTYMQVLVVKVRNNNGMEEMVQIVNTQFSSSSTNPTDANKLDRLNNLFTTMRAKLNMNATVIVAGNLDFGDEGVDQALNERLYTKMDEFKFVDAWPHVNSKDSGYTLDYDRNKNAINRADNARASKYSTKRCGLTGCLCTATLLRPMQCACSA